VRLYGDPWDNILLVVDTLQEVLEIARQKPHNRRLALALVVTNMQKSRRVYVVLALVVLGLAMALVFRLTSPPVTGTGPVNIEIETDKQSYLPGVEVQFRVYVYNPRFWHVPYPSMVEYRIGNEGLTRQMTLTSPPPTFVPWSRVLYDTYVWDQKAGTGGNRTQVQPGNYTLTVSFGGPVDYGKGGSCAIEIRSLVIE